MHDKILEALLRVRRQLTDAQIRRIHAHDADEAARIDAEIAVLQDEARSYNTSAPDCCIVS